MADAIRCAQEAGAVAALYVGRVKDHTSLSV